MNIPAVTPEKAGEIMEAVIARGDLAELSPQERAKYYVRVCESVGLNPMTKPFEYITLNGKLTLYARKDCTDQLRALHSVSVTDLTESERDGVFIVTAKVENGKGRRDASKGAVTIQGLKGDNLANAIMKAETKAKRRATLSVCGLGFLDETEIETMPSAIEQKSSTSVRQMMRDDIQEATGLTEKEIRALYMALLEELKQTPPDEIDAWAATNGGRMNKLPMGWQGTLKRNIEKRKAQPVDDEPEPHDPVTGELPPRTKPAGTTIVPSPKRLLETEIAAQQAAKPEPSKPTLVESTGDPLDLPNFLDRRKGTFDERAWQIEVGRRVASATSTDDLVAVQTEICTPNRKSVSEASWAWHVGIIRDRMAALAKPAEPTFDAVQWLKDVEGACLGAEDTTTLEQVKNTVLMTARSRVPQADWESAVLIYKRSVDRVTSSDILSAG